MYQVEKQHLHTDVLLDRLFNFSISVNGILTHTNQNKIHFIYVRAFRIFYCKRL